MSFARNRSRLLGLVRRILPLVLVLAEALTASGANPNAPVITSPLTATGTVGVPFTYTITATGRTPITYGVTPIPPAPGLTGFDPTTGVISGTPTTAGVYSVTISATNSFGSDSKTLVITIVVPNFVGFRLPDFLMSAGAPNNPRLMLQMGADGATTANRFNATLEVDAGGGGGGGTWVPYNHFVGINDSTSWITNAPLPVRNAGDIAGTPVAFGPGQLTQSPPGVYMKADPRATRFGIFQMDTNPSTTASRIMLSPWPTADASVPNGFGGDVGTTFPGPVEHAPARFSGAAYYPATFAINGPNDARSNATTIYGDNDNVTRPADAKYLNHSVNPTGSSTPYDTTSAIYRPIMLNRPFRNVGELGYAFRDLPWKTLDFFTDKSADAGLLDIFTINDGTPVLDGSGNTIGMAPPTRTAGSVNLNTTQAADLQAIFAGSILDEINSTTVSGTGTGATDAPVLANNIVTATSATPMQNKAELLTRAGLPETILATALSDNQAVKTRREVVARALSSVSQTRVWNLVIDVVAQSGHFKPNAGSLQNDFIVEGEQHYWVHVAIDRFTGRVIDKQIEVVNE
jgi:hypothetical protein